MKICFAINNLCAGGGERVFSSLVNEIASSTCHELSTICFLDNYYQSLFFQLCRKVNKYLVDYESSIQMETALLEIRPDVVVSFLNPMNYAISIVTKKLGIPHIACERNNPYYSPTNEQARAHRDEAFGQAAGCVFQTKNAASYFEGKTKGVCTTIINPVMLEISNPPTYDGNRPDKIVAVGRYAPQKDYFTMMKAFSLFLDKHPTYTLECFGKDSGTLSDIMSYTQSLGIGDKVVFNGETREVHERIQSAKMFLMTTLFEGLPNALAEAASLGLPCIASDIPGIRDLVERFQFGFLCPPKDADGFAEAMNHIVCDKALAKVFSQNGKRLREEARIDTIAKQWLDFIHVVINKSKGKC